MWSLAYPNVRGALICLVVAMVYIFLWPGRNNRELFRQFPLWRRVVLRWFHSLTWVLIAISCLLWSKLTAILAAVVYVIFLVTARLRPASPEIKL
ncbi:MAG TPA: hypothetical protein VIW67_08015 [Terriglobales bacterium]|jgi:hypothetical protein